MKTQVKINELERVLEEIPRGVLNIIKKDSSDISDCAKLLALRAFVYDRVLLYRRDSLRIFGLRFAKTYDYDLDYEALLSLGIAEIYETTFGSGFYGTKERWLQLKERSDGDRKPTPMQYVAYWSQN